MKFFLESLDKGVWDAVVNGPFKPIKIVEWKTVLKEFSQWTLDENKRAHYDVRAKNIISSALTLDDSSSSSESDGNIEEKTNLCLMAGTGSSKSSVSSFNSNDHENNNYELLDGFNELHKEATKLKKSNNKLRGEIKWLEGRVNELEEENENLIISLEKLEKSKKHSDEGLTPTKDEDTCLRRLSMFRKEVH